MLAAGSKVEVPHMLYVLAEAQLSDTRVDDARALLVAAKRLTGGLGDALYAAEAQRLKGLLAHAEDAGPAGCKSAALSFEAAIAIAHRQGARALELRAAIDLARVTAAEGDGARAADALAVVRSSFNDGFDTADLARADSLLRSLAVDVRRSRPGVHS
jgi:hypothetical protein